MLKDSLLKFFKLDGIASNLVGYVETRMELLKLELREDLARGLSRVIVFILLAFIATLFIFFISMALAYKLGEYIGEFGGFAVVAGIYLVAGIVFYTTRDRVSQLIEKQVMDMTKKKN
jgi:uncharacterized membrane protein YqjE